MLLWCYDEGRPFWGRELSREAADRGHDAALFSSDNGVEGGYAFMHVRQYPPNLQIDQGYAEVINGRCTLIPDIRQIRLYEDKERQYQCFGKWMPETRIFHSAEEVEYLEFPFMSKSRHGAASINVRLIESRKQADAEVEQAFASGIKAHRYRQQGYLIWQRFLAGNDGDYRVIRIGRQHMVLRRWNRKDSPRASGSGSFTPITDYSDELEEVLETSKAFFDEIDTRWCGIDLVKDFDTNEWKILETTVGWTFKVYLDCAFLGTEYTGRDTWKVLINEIEAGAFDI